MSVVKVNVPSLGESIVEVTVLEWKKNVGDSVQVDDILAVLESEKAAVDLPSPVAGVLSKQVVPAGGDVAVGQLLAEIDSSAKAAASPAAPAKAPVSKAAAASSSAAPAASAAPVKPNSKPTTAPAPARGAAALGVSPSVRMIAAEHGVDPHAVAPTGPKGNLVKGDIIRHLQSPAGTSPAGTSPAGMSPVGMSPVGMSPLGIATASPLPPRDNDPRGEKVVKMSRLRRSIAQRLKDAQNNAAILTTFNEIEMDRLMEARALYRDEFTKKHGDTKLGMMSFFVLASVQALKEFPAINAEIYGQDIVYKNYYDIGIALASPAGLVVPILRNADQMSVASIEKAVVDLGKRGRDGAITMEEMTGGTFTITNGGVFGSLLSTPILNPPQSAILGMHKLQKRPIVDAKGNIKAATMMYVALSYDHRIVDGREAVQFLVRIKEMVEDPLRLLLQI